MTTAAVDLVVNVWEGTYRAALAPGFLEDLQTQNLYRFARTVIVVNNVDNRDSANAMLDERRSVGVVDTVHWVQDELGAALRIVGLDHRALGAIPHYSDWAYVMVAEPGSEWFVHWDPEVRLRNAADWITPAIEAMSADDRIMASSPLWWTGLDEKETLSRAGRHALTQGFSDQLFLGRRGDFRRPIYSRRCIARRRYPLAHLAYIFESRVDAHMRHERLVRLVDCDVVYEHPAAGGSYPISSRRAYLRSRFNHAVLSGVRSLPRALRPYCCRTL